MRIFILAGTGFVGSAVVDLLSDQHEVMVFHRGQDCTSGGKVRHLHGDRAQLEAYKPQISDFRPDVTLDMVPQNRNDARQALRALGGLTPRLVGISSISVYQSFGRLIRTEPGDRIDQPCAETAPLRAVLYPYRGLRPRAADDPKRWLDDYDKIEVERRILGDTEVAGAILRLPLVYGPGDPDNRVGQYAVPMLQGASSVMLQPAAAMWRNARGFVRNIAAAIALVTVSNGAHGAYNVAEPEDDTERDWILRIAAAAGWSGAIIAPPPGSLEGFPLDEFPPETDYAQDLRMDTTRIRQELGFREPIDRQAGLAETIAALRA